GEPLHCLRRHQDEPAVRRVVTVRRVEGGATGAEGAVEPEFDRAHGELTVAHGRGPAALPILAPGLLATERREHAKGEAAALDEAGVRGGGGGGEAGVLRPPRALCPAPPRTRFPPLLPTLPPPPPPPH